MLHRTTVSKPAMLIDRSTAGSAKAHIALEGAEVARRLTGACAEQDVDAVGVRRLSNGAYMWRLLGSSCGKSPPPPQVVRSAWATRK